MAFMAIICTTITTALGIWAVQRCQERKGEIVVQKIAQEAPKAPLPPPMMILPETAFIESEEKIKAPMDPVRRVKKILSESLHITSEIVTVRNSMEKEPSAAELYHQK